MFSKSQKEFLSWLRRSNPAVYAGAKRRADAAMGLGAADTSINWWDSFISGAKELVPVIVQARSQKNILDVQLRRAEQGLSPLNTSQIAPTVQVQAGISPELKRLLIPALGIGAALLFYMMSKKKRR